MKTKNRNSNCFNPTVGIAVDCSTTGGNPGHTECRGIDIETGQIVFDEQVGYSTNNLGEWLAIAYGALYITENKLNIPLYSDSQTAIQWYKNKMCKTNIFRDYPDTWRKNPNLAQMLVEAEEIVEKCRVEVRFWDNRVKENLADYNRK